MDGPGGRDAAWHRLRDRLRSGPGAAARACRSAAPARELEHRAAQPGAEHPDGNRGGAGRGGVAGRGAVLSQLQRHTRRDPGFVRDGVLLAEYDLTGRPVDETGMRRFAAMLLAKLRALPAVRGAAIASAVPLDIHGLPTRFISVEGRPRNEASPDQALANTVTPGYSRVMGIPLLQGKDFADLDDPAAPAQAIVNEEFVRRFLVGVQPLGRRVEARGRSYVIAAVARNSLYNGFGEPPLPIGGLSVPRSAGRDWRGAPAHAGGKRNGARAGHPPDCAGAGSRVAGLRHPDAERSHRVEPDFPSRAGADVQRARAAAALGRGNGNLRGGRLYGVAANERDWRSAGTGRDHATGHPRARRREPRGSRRRGAWRLDDCVLRCDGQLAGTGRRHRLQRRPGRVDAGGLPGVLAAGPPGGAGRSRRRLAAGRRKGDNVLERLPQKLEERLPVGRRRRMPTGVIVPPDIALGEWRVERRQFGRPKSFFPSRR